jgi:hypothetical protein
MLRLYRKSCVDILSQYASHAYCTAMGCEFRSIAIRFPSAVRPDRI